MAKSKKELRSERNGGCKSAVTKAGRRSNPQPRAKIKPVAVVISYATREDLAEYIPTQKADEKSVPVHVQKELERMFLGGTK